MRHDPLDICGRLDDPGVAVDIPKYVDYSTRQPTPDQRRIARVLADLVGPTSDILHVGVGNSALAAGFADRVHLIYGLTVSENEQRHACGLGLTNYRVLRLSKHAGDFSARIAQKFDFILDNNLGAFCCCRYHFYLMFDNYLRALKGDGLILTDEFGLGWACCDPTFLLDYAGLLELEKVLPLRVARLTESVIAIRAHRELAPRPAITRSYRLCHQGGLKVVEERPV